MKLAKGGEKMNNASIRQLINKSRVRYYEIAHFLGVSECTLSRWLRFELDEEKQTLIINAINELKKA